ncbi:MAG: DUF998 domain-containing protein [Oscillospiraceae bacterium]|nr:DUF998 domain-containing protein [Oscillospiraceae bacterium]
MTTQKRTLIHRLGLLGLVSLLAYTAAVLFAPSAYPGYDWKSRAVSDLMSDLAPSRKLWTRIATLYGVSGIVSVTVVCVFIAGRFNRLLRSGIYLFAVMNWVSYVGYGIFPLSDNVNAGGFQDTMHIAVTIAVVALSIASLVLIIIGGLRKRLYTSLALWAFIALAVMLAGAIGTGLAPVTYFGIFERFSVFAATGFNAVLGIYLFNGFSGR